MRPERSAQALAMIAAATLLLLASTAPAGAAEAESNSSIDIAVDCNTSAAQFHASNETRYVASVTVVDISPTQVSSVRQTRIVAGNATVTSERRGDVIAAFASTETLGDNETVSVKRVCEPANETNAAC